MFWCIFFQNSLSVKSSPWFGHWWFCCRDGVSVEDFGCQFWLSWAFILTVLEYCSPVWMSATSSHLLFLDRIDGQVSRLSGGSISCDLWHRRSVASLCVLLKINSLVIHPVRGLLPAQYVLRRQTRGALAGHSRSFEMPRSRTVQLFRSVWCSIVEWVAWVCLCWWWLGCF